MKDTDQQRKITAEEFINSKGIKFMSPDFSIHHIIPLMEEYAFQFSLPESKVKDGFEKIIKNEINLPNRPSHEAHILEDILIKYKSFLPVETETKSVTDDVLFNLMGRFYFKLLGAGESGVELVYKTFGEELRSLLQTERRKDNE